MSDYKVYMIDYSGDHKPEGDGYAPQIILTASRGRLENVTELNTGSLPFTGEEFNNWRDELASRQLDLDDLARFVKIHFGIEMIHKNTTGFSQGDWGYSFVFGTPEFFQLTGATEISESDHNDLCAWIWGDVYDVTKIVTQEVSHVETCNLGHDHVIVDTPQEDETFIIYGMDEAMKYGDIEEF